MSSAARHRKALTPIPSCMSAACPAPLPDEHALVPIKAAVVAMAMKMREDINKLLRDPCAYLHTLRSFISGPSMTHARVSMRQTAAFICAFLIEYTDKVSSSMRNRLLAVAVCAGLPWSALAQELELDAELNIVGAALSDDEINVSDEFLLDTMLGVHGDHVFENGVLIGARLEGRFQQNNSTRPAFAGNFDAQDTGTVVFERTPSAGFARSSSLLDDGNVAALEQAFVYVSGGWGEVSLGKDVGVAARLDARPPKVQQTVSAFSPSLDPTGLAFVRARNDPTGNSIKVSYLSPRWIGFRLGASFSPQAEPDGVNFDPNESSGVDATANLEDVVEAAISFDRKFGKADIRLRTALTYTRGESASVQFFSQAYEAVGAGLEIERGDWRGGVRFLSSNNAVSSGDYDALEIGITKELGPWTIGAEYGHAEDGLLRLEGQSVSLNFRREISDFLGLGISYVSNDLDFVSDISQEVGAVDGFIMELSVRKK